MLSKQEDEEQRKKALPENIKKPGEKPFQTLPEGKTVQAEAGSPPGPSSDPQVRG